MDTAVGCTGAGTDNGQGLGSEAVDPLACGDWLASVMIRPHGRPVALFLDLLVGNGAFDHKDERFEQALLSIVKKLHELVAILVSKHRIVKVNSGQTGYGTQ